MKRKAIEKKRKSLSSYLRWEAKQPKYLVAIKLRDGSTKEIVVSEEEAKLILKKGRESYVRSRIET